MDASLPKIPQVLDAAPTPRSTTTPYFGEALLRPAPPPPPVSPTPAALHRVPLLQPSPSRAPAAAASTAHPAIAPVARTRPAAIAPAASTARAISPAAHCAPLLRPPIARPCSGRLHRTRHLPGRPLRAPPPYSGRLHRLPHRLDLASPASTTNSSIGLHHHRRCFFVLF